MLHKNPDAYFKYSKSPAEWQKGLAFPCGQCLMCRINKRRLWTTRLYLEARCHHPDSISFFTLTYNDENLTYAESAPTLVYRDVQLFLKRLRKALFPLTFRLYCGCEYGSQSLRPHYHLILFGVPPSCYEVVSRCWSSPTSHTLSHCYQCVTKHSANVLCEIKSGLGNTYLGYDCSMEAMQYVAGYVTKKIAVGRLPKVDENYRTRYVDGRERERAIMSRNPGIGVPALLSISKQLKDHADLKHEFPTSLSICGKNLPFDRTLLSYLSYLFPEYFDPFKAAYQAKDEYDNLVAHPELLSGPDKSFMERLGIVGAYRFSSDSQKAKNIEAKLRIKGVFDREA